MTQIRRKTEIFKFRFGIVHTFFKVAAYDDARSKQGGPYMDTYENKIPEEESSAPQEAPVQEPVPAVEEVPEAAEIISVPEEPQAEEEVPAPEEPQLEEEVPVRTSPYADSPYVMQHAPAAPRKKKKHSGLGKKLLCAFLALALVAGACVATGIVVSEYWEERLDRVEDQFADRLEALEDKLKQNNTGISVSGSPQSTAGGAERHDSLVRTHVRILTGVIDPAQQYSPDQANGITSTGPRLRCSRRRDPPAWGRRLRSSTRARPTGDNRARRGRERVR
jgi:hypothetical protein